MPPQNTLPGTPGITCGQISGHPVAHPVAALKLPITPSVHNAHGSGGSVGRAGILAHDSRICGTAGTQAGDSPSVLPSPDTSTSEGASLGPCPPCGVTADPSSGEACWPSPALPCPLSWCPAPCSGLDVCPSPSFPPCDGPSLVQSHPGLVAVSGCPATGPLGSPARPHPPTLPPGVRDRGCYQGPTQRPRKSHGKVELWRSKFKTVGEKKVHRGVETMSEEEDRRARAQPKHPVHLGLVF